jgi:hypothetical protein
VGRITFLRLDASANLGPGVATLPTAGDFTLGWIDAPRVGADDDNRITGNRGDGLRAGPVRVAIRGRTHLTGNGGWGVMAEGPVVFGDEGTQTDTFRHEISRNGAGADCRTFTLSSGRLVASSVACGGGGVFSDDVFLTHRSTLNAVDLVGNAGPGVLSTGPVHDDDARHAINLSVKVLPRIVSCVLATSRQ